MRVHKIPTFVKNRFKDFTWDIENEGKKIFLTFDDGPTDQVTDWVLAKLDEFSAKATFFSIAKNIEKTGGLYQKLIDRGHSTGNHTYSHLNGWRTKTEEYLNDIHLAKTLINSDLFRPPYGRITRQQKNKLKHEFRIIMWDVLTFDYDRSFSRNACLKNVVEKTTGGSVVVFHDSEKARKNLYFVLPEFLKIMTDKGYVFEKI